MLELSALSGNGVILAGNCRSTAQCNDQRFPTLHFFAKPILATRIDPKSPASSLGQSRMANASEPAPPRPAEADSEMAFKMERPEDSTAAYERVVTEEGGAGGRAVRHPRRR
jgi:hypothetical protein